MESHTIDDIQTKAAFWGKNPYFDEATRQEIQHLDPAELEERFYTDLEFGTGGLRGKLGAGTNRMNIYVVRKITQGLADTIQEQGKEAMRRGVVIACDSRRCSTEFAQETALVLAANGICAYRFNDLRPTPELSFAVRYLQAVAGVNITASHNPKEYNGYKVYGEDGGQLPPDIADRVTQHIKKRVDWIIEPISKKEAYRKGLLIDVNGEVDQAYRQAIRAQLLYADKLREQGDQVKIVYTPLHGSGIRQIPAILQETGFSNVFVVPEQAEPDGEFPTVRLPNPEDPEAFALALVYFEFQQADLALASDPDADRLGLYVRDEKGDYVRFTGNQIGVLLTWYLLSQRKKLGKLPADGKVITTVASTDLGAAVAAHFGVEVIHVLVGFKYVGEQIRIMEQTGKGTFLFGYEESFGYLAGTHARDKDAVQAALILAEAAWYYKTQEQRTLPQVLEEIQQMLGYYADEQISVTKEGRAGKAAIEQVMQTLRQHCFQTLGGIPVAAVEDYSNGAKTNLKDGRVEPISLPRTDALRYLLQGGGFVMARPSGTEPKIKFYFSIRSEKPDDLQERMQKIQSDFFAPIQSLLV